MTESNEILDEVRVKNEPISYSQSISQTKEDKLKKEPKDNEIQTSKSHIKSTSEEVEIKAEEKFSAAEEFTNKISIAFINEETTQATTSNDDNSTINTNIQRNKSQKSK